MFENIINSKVRDILLPQIDLIIKKYFRNRQFEIKEDFSLVTIADLEVEECIKNFVLTEFGNDHIVCGEESVFDELEVKKCQFVWIVDPIDGTSSFVCGRATFMVLIGVYDVLLDKIVYSLAYQPILQEVFCSFEGRTFFNGTQLLNNVKVKFENAIVGTTAPTYLTKEQNVWLSCISEQTKATVFGGDSYIFCLLALGTINVAFEPNLCMKIWDIAPLIEIVRNSGNVFVLPEGFSIKNALANNKFKSEKYSFLAASNLDILNNVITLGN